VKIHEYQARELFEEYGIPTAKALLVERAGQAADAARKLGGFVAVKAQVLVGGRAKAGGIKLARNPEEAERAAEEILGMKIKHLTVEKVLVSQAVYIQKEFYLGLAVDCASKMITFMITGEGGVDIEELAVSRPEAILKYPVNPHIGLDEESLRETLGDVFQKPRLLQQAQRTALSLYRLFMDKDCSLVEINPYALVEGEKLLALDAKINFDDNALYKHPEILEMRNPEEYSEEEIKARQAGLSFVSMDGDIGCIVNGAGLAMATTDMIKLFGGASANFLDVGGSSSPEKVLNALKIILGNPRVKAILINIFGGITRCDDIARGILMALGEIEIPVPLVIRLIGTNQAEGREMLKKAGLVVAENMTEAVHRVLGEVK
jgi:succinyl-CoA synthetase beta subunit